MKKICKILFVLLISFLYITTISAKNVSVTVTPTTAVVYQKGKVVEPVSPGVYSIQVSIVDLVFVVECDGYDSEQFIINLKSPSTMKVNLKPNRKEVSITSHPATADIYVDGRLMGQSPIHFTINKGESKNVILMTDGYDRYVKSVNFNDQADIHMSYNIEMVQNRRDVNVLVDAPSAEFWVDGVLVTKGKNSATFQLYKEKPVELVIRAEGYLEYSRMMNFNENVSSYNLTKELAVDQAYTASEPGTDIANKRFEAMVKKDMTRDDAIARMKYYISELFETLEINDNVAGWYRTAWNVEQYPDKIIRSRIELKQVPDNGDGQLKFKLLLQSQVAYKSSPKDEDYRAWDRVLKKYAKMLSDIRNLIE
ncbi:MAG: PEGA domain-containing protein [Bacteroidales bacterium]|nr:PEGA domain-containing protein [Bacteroidales bacterium]